MPSYHEASRDYPTSREPNLRSPRAQFPGGIATYPPAVPNRGLELIEAAWHSSAVTPIRVSGSPDRTRRAGAHPADGALAASVSSSRNRFGRNPPRSGDSDAGSAILPRPARLAQNAERVRPESHLSSALAQVAAARLRSVPPGTTPRLASSSGPVQQRQLLEAGLAATAPRAP